MTWTTTTPGVTEYTQTAGMDGDTTTDNVTELAAQAAASAAAAIVAKINWRGAWLTSTAFAVSDAIETAGSSYICIVAHTSGTFATDLTAVKWELLAQKGADGGGGGGGGGDLLAANNLSDLAAAGTARTNLGLGTAATTAAADYATAAQGTLADDAAPLASPTFTGVAAAPTATTGTNTTQLATTAFVLANVGSGGGDVLAANNLSDLSNAGTARTNIGVAIGSDVQAFATVLDNTTASYTSAEETKLNDIETSADVTDSTNVTAAGALMDSELASIADVKALDQSVVSGATPTFGIANMTLADTSLVVVNTTNMQTFADGVDSALLKARGTGFTSTYVSTVSVGGTTFAQPAVNGEIYSDQGYFAISYAGATGITVATLSSPSTYVYIDNAGNLQQQTSTPTRQDKSRKMFTMRIAIDTVAETVLGFEYFNNPIGHYANSIRDIYEALVAQGVPFKGGQIITGRGGDMGFDVGAGTITEFGGTGDINNANVLSLDAVANATFDLLTRTTIASENQTNLPQSWDNATTITTLGSGTFVGHRLYRFSNGQFAVQYGQGNYANIVLARAGVLLEDYVLNERLLNATFFGWWIIGQTATNTGGTTLTEFREYTIGVQGGSSSGLAGCLLRGNNLSDLLDVGAAQVNLDLEPGVDVQAYAAVLANTTASYTSAEEAKLSGIETAADVTDTTNVVAALTAGTNVTISGGGTIAATDTNTTYVSSDFDHDSLTGFVANEHIDWTTDQGATNINAGNYTDTNTTYSVGDGGLTQNNFTNDDHTKLNDIEASADVTDATNVTAAGALMDSEVTNLAAVKAFDGADYATAAQGTLADSAAQITVSSTAPSSPSVNDLWVDTT